MPMPMEPTDYRRLAGLCRDRCAVLVNDAEEADSQQKADKLVLDAAEMLRAAAVFDQRADSLEEYDEVDGTVNQETLPADQ